MITLIMCIARQLSFMAALMFFAKLWKEEVAFRSRLITLLCINIAMGCTVYYFAAITFEDQVHKMVAGHIQQMIEFGKELEEMQLPPDAMPGDEIWKK